MILRKWYLAASNVGDLGVKLYLTVAVVESDHTVSTFTCTPIFYYYFKYENIPNLIWVIKTAYSIWIFRNRLYSESSIF